MREWMRRRPARVIEAVLTFADGREVCTETRAGQREYYARLGAMVVRQRNLCGLCGLWMGRDAQFDHESGRGAGGGMRDDRIVVVRDGAEVWQNAALCGPCNKLKGSQRFHWVGRAYIPAMFASVLDWHRAEVRA